ncbi:aldo-keto reductase AKR2E4-like isoform X2 [Pectinophora gossypiella]|uniref:aldo-keto reductase AKR2E4-like isoform X2 n=1 Tax=Pectinophora gossypiella TaxID=13191 RepID=UPI00214EB697|nr:aldo-keto reductase AKR2E4-like isoform X2 [Pectinophora gossypiella]
MAKVQIPTTTLNNGKTIPVLGYGTWLGLDDKFNFPYEDIPKLVETLSYAIDTGYRHIDTAHLYRVEPEIGETIAKKIQEGVCKREDLFITTKVWHQFHKPTDVEVSVRASLRRLRMDYVDQLLMHWPMSITEEGVDEKIDYLETWKGFEAVLELGLARSIGVSNFNVEQMKRLLENSKVPPAANQVEINLNLGQKDLVDYCKSQNIAVVAYSPFGTMVPSRNAPDSPEPKMDNPVLLDIAKKHGKTVTQVTLRYLHQRGIISIPKTVTKSRVVENASIFDFQLDAADCELISKFDNGYRTVRPVFWQDYQGYPFDKVDNKMAIPPALLKWKNGAKQDID